MRPLPRMVAIGLAVALISRRLGARSWLQGPRFAGNKPDGLLVRGGGDRRGSAQERYRCQRIADSPRSLGWPRID
jgi:hypothetical protein